MLSGDKMIIRAKLIFVWNGLFLNFPGETNAKGLLGEIKTILLCILGITSTAADGNRAVTFISKLPFEDRNSAWTFGKRAIPWENKWSIVNLSYKINPSSFVSSSAGILAAFSQSRTAISSLSPMMIN